MIISFAKSFLFLHIPKTAGMSVSAALRPYRNPLERSLKARVLRRLLLGNLDYRYVNFDAHTHWPILRAKMLLPREVFERIYKFTFVRHPVDWQVSMFKHIMRHEHLEEYRRRFALVYRHRKFEDYVRWRVDSGPIPQMTQMVDLDGRILVDFVGRFEDLERDFRSVCEHLGLAENLRQVNRSPSDQSVQVPDKVRAMIIEAYEPDMKAFGFEVRGARKDWTFHKGLRYAGVGEVLRKVNGEACDAWEVYRV